ncbi:unnamed protein product [Gordionus sp. m RMFG-2023]|uniref:carbohydrate sulfotransferase 11-like n=1 Tax=Gordionus sp. m RMFG-2023 TaxID=3053472 RepID=UPI0030E501A6
MSTTEIAQISQDDLEEIHKQRVLNLKRNCVKLYNYDYNAMPVDGAQLVEFEKDLLYENTKNQLYFSVNDMNPRDFKNFIYDDLNKLIYCYVPKVACTNWKRVLLVLSGKGGPTPLDIRPDQTHSRENFQFLNSLNMSEIKFRLSKYLTYVVVRDPIERVISAFRDKFEMSYSEYFQKTFGIKIIKKYRKSPSKRSLERGHDVTFQEFVSYLSDSYDDYGQRGLNEHWKSAYAMCHPCAINYDVVGRYETLEIDANHILKKARLIHKVQFPPMPQHHVGNRRTSHMINRYLRRLTTESVSRFELIYGSDLFLFNYTFSSGSMVNLPLDMR